MRVVLLFLSFTILFLVNFKYLVHLIPAAHWSVIHYEKSIVEGMICH